MSSRTSRKSGLLRAAQRGLRQRPRGDGRRRCPTRRPRGYNREQRPTRKFGFPTAHGIVVAVPWRRGRSSSLSERRGLSTRSGAGVVIGTARRGSRGGKSGGNHARNARGRTRGRLGFRERRPSAWAAFTGCRGIGECVRHAGEDDICASGGTSRRQPARSETHPVGRDR